MAETTDEIMQHIETERQHLQRSMVELEYRVQDVTDVRKQIGRHPMIIPGSVIALSLLLAMVFWRR